MYLIGEVVEAGRLAFWGYGDRSPFIVSAEHPYVELVLFPHTKAFIIHDAAANDSLNKTFEFLPKNWDLS